MAQVLKDEIREKIYDAAMQVFYEKDFRSAKIKDIAERAGIPVGLVYSYFKNKEALFDDVVSSVYFNFEQGISAEENSELELPSEKFEDIGEEYLLKLFEQHKKLVILIDKSAGTSHEYAKDRLISVLEKHIKLELNNKKGKQYNDMFIHILSSYFTESLLEIARHYEGKEWAKEMLGLVMKCYYEGVNSL